MILNVDKYGTKYRTLHYSIAGWLLVGAFEDLVLSI